MAIKIWDGSTDGDYGVAANWTPSGVPIAGDDVFFLDNSVNVTAGLNQSAIALTSFNVDMSYLGSFATVSTFLQIRATTVVIGAFRGTGTILGGGGRWNMDFGSVVAPTITVNNTATTATDAARAPVRILVANASAKLFILGGNVGLADDPAATSTIGTIDVVASNTDVEETNLVVGTSVTVTTMTTNGGSSVTESLPATLNVDGGVLKTEGSDTLATANVRAGRFISNATGDITTLNAEGGIADFLQSNEIRTVANVNQANGATILRDKDVVAFTNGIVPSSTKAANITIIDA